MEELHAAVAAHLRGQRRQIAETGESEAAILNIWQDRYMAPRCKVCGASVDDDQGGFYNLADMRKVRECASHYTPF